MGRGEGALSPGVKELGRDAKYSSPSSVKTKNVWSRIFHSPTFNGAVLNYAQRLNHLPLTPY